MKDFSISCVLDLKWLHCFELYTLIPSSESTCVFYSVRCPPRQLGGCDHDDLFMEDYEEAHVYPSLGL